MKPGRELDALIAEKVMGISLRIPRERAVALIGATYTSVTGPTFTLRTGDVVGIPDDLPVLPEDASANERYFRYVGEWLLNDSEDEAVRTKVARQLDTLRDTPKPYSTDISSAWEVVEAMRSKGFRWAIYDDRRSWTAYAESPGEQATGEGDTTAQAICLAALQAFGVSEGSPPTP